MAGPFFGGKFFGGGFFKAAAAAASQVWGDRVKARRKAEEDEVMAIIKAIAPSAFDHFDNRRTT